MPNAKNAHEVSAKKVLVLATTGAGKTTQFLTLKGKKFAYLFDPNAILSLQGHDVEYEEFLPDLMNLDVKSLSKDKKTAPTMQSQAAEAYREWEKDFETKISNGFFDDYDWIMMDSFTTFADMVMDEVLRVNGRADSWPQQDDYGPQMLTLKNVVRTMTSLGKNIYFTGHTELKQDELSKRIFYTPMMTGRLKSTLPLLFSEIFSLEAESDGKGEVVYNLQCKPSRDTPLIRTSIKGLDPYENVTLDFSKDLIGQGLGGIFNWYDKQQRGES